MTRFFFTSVLLTLSLASFSQSPILVKDVYEGSLSSFPASLIQAGDITYFTTPAAVYDNLWRTNGTAKGTISLGEVNVDSRTMTNVNGTLFFAGWTLADGLELWKSDGTSAGTVQVKNINPVGDSKPYNLIAVNGTLFFTAYEPKGSIQLWKSDGTPEGTVPISRLAEENNYLGYMYGVAFKNKFFYTINSDKLRLWQSDGTSSGTYVVKELSGSNNFLINWNNERLLFSGANAFPNGTLWQSDGTTGGTTAVNVDNDKLLGFLDYPIVTVNQCFFSAGISSVNNTYGLWQYNGIKSPSLIKLNLRTTGKGIVLNDIVYFPAFLVNDLNNSVGLWRTDGTPNGTYPVPVSVDGLPCQNIQELVLFKNKLYFTARQYDKSKSYLFVSNGTVTGTKVLFDVPYEPGYSSSVILGATDESLYLRLEDKAHGVELWKLPTPCENINCSPLFIKRLK